MSTEETLRQLIWQHKKALENICQKYHIAKLYVFGSAITQTFQPEHSDIDLIVQFEILPLTPEDKGQLYWDLLDALEMLFGRKIDLLLDKRFVNPYFQQEVENTKLLIYDQAQSQEVFV